MHNLEMFASIQDPEFVQGQSQDVPDRELGPDRCTFNTKIEIYSKIMKC